ncbi:hypothetical protein CGC20_18825 [Leishmania donovani]|uniref:Uncharacterized protein n=1 Tax=Leishmania donovani TaxID=5661 RepID=A0A504XQ78_LEIDO|nr:hypothetical protein CGC20_18825 [Leishmania donovani]
MLCASCQHSFPEDMLAPASFSTRVGRYLSRSTSLLCATRGKTSKDDHRLSQLAQLLQQLCGAVQEEAQLLQERQNDLPVATFSSSTGRTGQQQQQPKSRGGAPHTVSFASPSDRCRGTPSAELCGALDGTGRLPYVGMSSSSFSVAPVASPRIIFEGTVPSYQLKRMITAFDLVSATLYNMLESLAVQCRANVALLWLRPRQNLSSSELVAPFVVGRDLSSLANSAPYCTVEFSIPCVVCQTGVALNLKPQPHLQNTATPSGADSMLTELMEHTNAAQLLVPVHDRYKERPVATRASTVNALSTIAVVHLIGSPINPVPFHRHNEEAVAQTSTLLSFIISSYYETMIAEWSNRFYVPTTLHATGKYAAGLDLRADDKVIDDFAAAPLLMLRTTVNNLSGHTSANDARDALKLLSQTRSGVDALKEDLLRRDISDLQKAQDAQKTRDTSAGTHSRLTADKKCAVQPPSVAVAAPVEEKRNSLSIAGINIPLTPPVPYASETATTAAVAFSPAAEPVPPSTEVLKADEVDLLEAVTLRRLRELGVDTSMFE